MYKQKKNSVLLLVSISILLFSCSNYQLNNPFRKTDLIIAEKIEKSTIPGTGRMYYSSDNGNTWHNTSPPSSNWIHCVAYGNGKFLNIGTHDNVWSSVNGGVSWFPEKSAENIGGSHTLLYTNSCFISSTLSNLKIFKLSDLSASWKVTDIIDGATIFDIACGNNRLIAVSHRKVFLSDDYGISWREVNKDFTLASHFNSITFINNTFIAVTSTGEIWRSLDYGENWTISGNFPGRFYGVTSGNNVLIAVGDKGVHDAYTLRSIDNGVTWTETSPIDGYWLQNISFGNNCFISVGYNGNIWKSLDNGLTWDNVSLPTTKINLLDVTFGGGNFVAVGGANF